MTGNANNNVRNTAGEKQVNLSSIASFVAHDDRGRLRVSKSTYKSTYQAAAGQLINYFGNLSVSDITEDDLYDWMCHLDDRVDNKEIAIPTRNSYIRGVKSMWSHMHKRGVKVCIAREVLKFRKELKTVKSVKHSDAYLALAFANPRDESLIRLALESGRRRGGLCNLHLDDFTIVFDEEILEYRVIGKTIEKGNKEQILFAKHHAAIALMNWLEIRGKIMRHMRVPEHGRVFINLKTGQPLAVDSLSQIMKELKRKAHLPQNAIMRLHGLRHTAAQDMLKYMSLPDVSAILGHEETSTTADIYCIKDPEQLADAFFKRRKG